MSHQEKDDKKKKIRDRNRRNWMQFMQADALRENVDIAAPDMSEARAKKHVKEEDKVWSAQLTTIRNRLDNSRRVSADRFNRFAGTSDGGGMGR